MTRRWNSAKRKALDDAKYIAQHLANNREGIRCIHEYKVARYAALYSAWSNASIELDKQILLISGGAVGLLVGLVTTANDLGCWILLIVGINLIGLFITMMLALYGFGQSAKLMKLYAENEDASLLEISVGKLESKIRWLFGVFLFLLFISSGLIIANKHDKVLTNTTIIYETTNEVDASQNTKNVDQSKQDQNNL